MNERKMIAVGTESAIKTAENNNTLVFEVDGKATKQQVKIAFELAYQVKVKKVNLLKTSTGLKKAYVALESENDALEIAIKIGII
jgi:large subunit ribosomal protein L23